MTEAKFDATTAERGSKWLTRGGQIVTFIAYAPEALGYDKIACVGPSGSLQTWLENGKWLAGDIPNDYDIVGPAPEPVILPECWVVRWVEDDGLWHLGIETSEYLARYEAAKVGGHITHIPAQEVEK